MVVGDSLLGCMVDMVYFDLRAGMEHDGPWVLLAVVGSSLSQERSVSRWGVQ
jgi:hypothetical protein